MVIQENIKCDIQFPNSTDIYIITEDDIIDEDVSITSQCCDDNTFSLGGVYSSQLTMTFRTSKFKTNIYDIRGAKITVYTKYDTESAFVSRGIFWVTSATRQKDIFNISASDSLIWLDNIPTSSDQLCDTLTLYLEQYRRTLYDIAKTIVLSTNAMILNKPCSNVTDLVNSITDLENNPSQMLFKWENPDINVNNDVYNNYRHWHKGQAEEFGTETTPREHLSFIAQIYGGFAYAKTNGNISFGRFFRNTLTEDSKRIPYENIELDSLDISAKQLHFSPVKISYDFGWSSWTYTNNIDNSELYAKIILENNPYLNGYCVENDIDLSNNINLERSYIIHRTLFDLLNSFIIAPNSYYSIDEQIASQTWIVPFSAKCHMSYRFKLGEHILITDDNNMTRETTITKMVWHFRGGYELSCTGGDTRMLSETLRNSQAKKVQRIIERKLS